MDSVISQTISLAKFDEALRLVQETIDQGVDEKRKIELFLLKNEICLLKGDVNEAGTFIDEAENLLAGITRFDQLMTFDLFLQKGRYFRFLGLNKEALRWLKDAERYSQGMINEHPNHVARLFNEMGAYYKQQLDDASSMYYFRKAVNTFQCRNKTDSITFIGYKIYLADALMRNNKTDEATELFSACVLHIQSGQYPLSLLSFESYTVIADYLITEAFDYKLADDLLIPLTTYANKYLSSDYYLLGFLYYTKSKLEYRRCDYENALLYSNHSLSIAQNYPVLSKKETDNLYLHACLDYVYRNDYNTAIEYCNKAIHTVKGTMRSPDYYYYLIGRCYYKMNQPEDAKKAFHEVIKMGVNSHAKKDINVISETYRILASIAENESDDDLAVYYLNESLKTANRISVRGDNNAFIYNNLSAIYVKKNNIKKALYFVQQSIIASCKTYADTSVMNNPELSDILFINNSVSQFTNKAYQLYLLYKKENKLQYLEAALATQLIAIELTDKMVSNIDDDNSGITMMDTKRREMNNAVSYATLLYLQTEDRLFAEQAFFYAEKSKMQIVLNRTLQKSRMLKAGIPDSVIQKDKNLNDKILELENLLSMNNADVISVNTRKAITEEITTLFDQREALKLKIEELYPNYHRSGYETGLLTIYDVQQMLDSNEVIVEYQLLNTEVITFIITADSFKILFNPLDKSLSEPINALREILTENPLKNNSNDEFSRFTGNSYLLYTKLIEPVHKYIKGKRLIIIPHNELTLIPFEILISGMPENKGRSDYRLLPYMIKDFTISYAYSVNLLLNSRQKKRSNRGTGIFLPDYTTYNDNIIGENYPPLYGAEKEASNVKTITHGILYKGSRANENTFKKKAGNYSILHIASHSELNEENPNLSCLVMSAPSDTTSDGRLYAYELMPLELDARMVVLSGCNTGYGVLKNNEGLISIARSFLYTGVRTIAYTLWQVADDAGSSLTSDFYHYISKGEELDDAMRDAKLSFLSSADPVKTHPFYWAGYVVVGETNSIPVRRNAIWLMITIVVILTGSLTFWLIKRFKS